MEKKAFKEYVETAAALLASYTGYAALIPVIFISISLASSDFNGEKVAMNVQAHTVSFILFEAVFPIVPIIVGVLLTALGISYFLNGKRKSLVFGGIFLLLFTLASSFFCSYEEVKDAYKKQELLFEYRSQHEEMLDILTRARYLLRAKNYIDDIDTTYENIAHHFIDATNNSFSEKNKKIAEPFLKEVGSSKLNSESYRNLENLVKLNDFRIRSEVVPEVQEAFYNVLNGFRQTVSRSCWVLLIISFILLVNIWYKRRLGNFSLITDTEPVIILICFYLILAIQIAGDINKERLNVLEPGFEYKIGKWYLPAAVDKEITNLNQKPKGIGDRYFNTVIHSENDTVLIDQDLTGEALRHLRSIDKCSQNISESTRLLNLINNDINEILKREARIKKIINVPDSSRISQ